MVDVSQNNLSNNKSLSDNSLSLWGDFNVDINFKDLALLFFPAVRNAMIQTRLLELYKVQADTMASILFKAKEIADKTGIKIQTLPAKFSLPVLEKMSLEMDDKEMQEQWAKLLVAAGKDYNSIHIQYSEILSQIGGSESRLLKEIFKHQNKDKFGRYYIGKATNLLEEYETNRNITQTAYEIRDNLKIRMIEIRGAGEYVGAEHDIHINVEYPERPVLEDLLFEIDYGEYSESTTIILERLNLVKIFYDSNSNLIALTEFGYKFVEELECVENKH